MDVALEVWTDRLLNERKLHDMTSGVTADWLWSWFAIASRGLVDFGSGVVHAL